MVGTEQILQLPRADPQHPDTDVGLGRSSPTHPASNQAHSGSTTQKPRPVRAPAGLSVTGPVNWVVVRSSLEVPVEVDLVPLGPMGRDSADVIPCNAAGYTHAEPFKPSDVMTAPAPESMPG